METIVALVDFCAGCSNDPRAHFFNRRDGTEIRYCRRLGIVAVRTVDSRRRKWMMLETSEQDLAAGILAAMDETRTGEGEA